MDLSEFDYEIPADRIAQRPLKERDASRLFVLRRNSGEITHAHFRELVNYLAAGDLLILNDTRVIPVRLYGRKPTGGKAEITLIREIGTNIWEALVKGLNEGRIIVGTGIIAEVSRLNGTSARVEFRLNPKTSEVFGNDIKNILNEIGAMPLPVYIKRTAEKTDLKQYQTVYAKNTGAVAAPTAGLHFTEDLLETIRAKGVSIRTVTLHVGYGTFKPVAVTDTSLHKMDEEAFEIPAETADAINSARAEGRRVIAVGTTVTRALESSASGNASGRISAGKGSASIFITPGYKFRTIDALLTNFHLPRSTPMMLASAFSGLETLKKAYAEADREGYRFFSYGDAMLVL